MSFFWRSQFEEAIAQGNLEKVQELFTGNIDRTQSKWLRNDGGFLHSALSKTPVNIGIVRFLVAHGADVNESKNSSKPLHIALESKTTDSVKTTIVDLLLSHGAKVNQCSSFCRCDTPLFIAIEKSAPLTVIRSLVSRNNVNHGSSYCRVIITPLSAALTNIGQLDDDKQFQLLQCLLHFGADVKQVQLANYRGFYHGLDCKVDILKTLVDKGADPELLDVGLLDACIKRDLDGLIFLLKCGAPFNTMSKLWRIAAYSDVTHPLITLITDMPKADNENYNPTEIIDILVNHVGIDQLFKMYIFDCSHTKVKYHHDIMLAVARLVYYGASVNILPGSPITPLKCAIDTCNVDVTELLLSNGASINRVNNGWCIYDDIIRGCVCEQYWDLRQPGQYHDMLRLLLSTGADPDAQIQKPGPYCPHPVCRILITVDYFYEKSECPKRRAMLYNSVPRAMQLLVAANCKLSWDHHEVNHSEIAHMDPLAHALKRGNKPTVRFLLEAGCVPSPALYRQDTNDILHEVRQQPPSLRMQCAFIIRRALGSGINNKFDTLCSSKYLKSVVLLEELCGIRLLTQ